MNWKRLFLIFPAAAVFLAGCAPVAVRETPEVVIRDKSNEPAGSEVYINDADLKKGSQTILTVQETTQQPKRRLADRSEIETLTDGFGNKTESRYFENHPRLRLVVLRTTADGRREVTVYGNGGDTKIVPELNDTALTASDEEIANAAKLTQSGPPAQPLFVKRSKSAPNPVAPLPSSAFPKPVAPAVERLENVEPQATPAATETAGQPDRPVVEPDR